MTLLSTFTILASLTLSCIEAKRLPHPRLRRSILDVQHGNVIVPRDVAPASWISSGLESYDKYHFRFEVIGCSDVTKDAEFFKTCCQPRKAGSEEDSNYPVACNLAAYMVGQPTFYDDKAVAKLLGDFGTEGDSDTYSWSESISSTFSQAATSIVANTTSSAAEESTSSWIAPPSSSPSSSPPSSLPILSGSVKGHSALATQKSDKSVSSDAPPSYTPSSSSFVWVAPPSSAQPETSSVWTPPSSSAPEWTPTTSEAPWTPSSSAPAWTPSSSAAPAPSSSSWSGETYTGTATWFLQNGNPGACGNWNSDSSKIVALDYLLYGNLGEQSQYCGRTVTITNTNTGAQVVALVADACPSCVSYGSLDLSVGAFTAIANQNDGVAPISWHFN